MSRFRSIATARVSRSAQRMLDHVPMAPSPGVPLANGASASQGTTPNSLAAQVELFLCFVLALALPSIVYGLFLCRRRHTHGGEREEQIRAAAAARAESERQHASEALPESILQSLPEALFKKGEVKLHDPECTVCLKDFEDQEALVTLPCCHVFHRECITEWFALHSTCPTCRFSLAPATASNDQGGTVQSSASGDEETQNGAVQSEVVQEQATAHEVEHAPTEGEADRSEEGEGRSIVVPGDIDAAAQAVHRGSLPPRTGGEENLLEAHQAYRGLTEENELDKCPCCQGGMQGCQDECQGCRGGMRACQDETPGCTVDIEESRDEFPALSDGTGLHFKNDLGPDAGSGNTRSVMRTKASLPLQPPHQESNGGCTCSGEEDRLSLFRAGGQTDTENQQHRKLGDGIVRGIGTRFVSIDIT